jgi:hypothetical protein
MNKLDPTRLVHPVLVQSVNVNPSEQVHTTDAGLDVEQYAFLLAWQAKLIAKAMKEPLSPHREVRALFGQPEPRQHEWTTTQRSLMDSFEPTTETRCSECRQTLESVVGTAGLRDHWQRARVLAEAIERGEAAECPGRKP